MKCRPGRIEVAIKISDFLSSFEVSKLQANLDKIMNERVIKFQWFAAAIGVKFNNHG